MNWIGHLEREVGPAPQQEESQLMKCSVPEFEKSEFGTQAQERP